MLEVKASSRAFAFSVTSCRASVCRQVRVVAFPLLDCAVVNSIQSALIYPERLRGRRTMTAPLSTRRSLALGPRITAARGGFRDDGAIRLFGIDSQGAA